MRSSLFPQKRHHLRQSRGGQEAPFCSSPFGVTLQEIMDAQKEKSVHLEVPEIMVHLCEGILKLNGHSALGIFRYAGDGQETAPLR